MYPYRYAVSLRVRHPKINPDNITKTVGIQPTTHWMVGKQRIDVKGNRSGGINQETYWATDLTKGKGVSSREITVEDYLAKQVSQLKKSEKFFKRLRDTGGRIEFFVALFCDKNTGADFPSLLLADMGKLGIDLSLDIFPMVP